MAGDEGGLRETASGPHRHLDSAAMFFCSLIKQPRGRKRRRLPREREEARWRRKRRKTDREEGGWEGGLVLWRWSDYEERKGTAGGTTGKKRRRMRKAALLGE